MMVRVAEHGLAARGRGGGAVMAWRVSSAAFTLAVRLTERGWRKAAAGREKVTVIGFRCGTARLRVRGGLKPALHSSRGI